MWNCLKLILSLSSFPSPLLSSFLSLFSPSSSSDTVAFREASWHLLTVIMILDLGPPHLQLMILVSSLLVFDLSVKSHNMTASGELQGHLILHLIMCKKKKKNECFIHVLQMYMSIYNLFTPHQSLVVHVYASDLYYKFCPNLQYKHIVHANGINIFLCF